MGFKEDFENLKQEISGLQEKVEKFRKLSYTYANMDSIQELYNKILVAPIITDFSYAKHSSIHGSGGIDPLDHGTLDGLTDDDHPQYSLVDATRAFTGALTGTSGYFATSVSADAFDGGVMATRVNSGSDTARRPRFNFIEGDYISIVATDNPAGDETNITIGADAQGFDPTSYAEFYDDFMSINGVASPVISDKPWIFIGVYGWSEDNNGVILIRSDATNRGHFSQSDGSGTFAKTWIYSLNPTFISRIAQLGASASTRRLGLVDATLNTAAEPDNGIYFRFTVDGNYIAVCRSGGSEDTIDTNVAAADGTFNILKFVVSGDGTSVEFFVDGVSKGSITNYIPTVILGISFGSNTTGTGRGVYIDFVHVRQDRS